MPVFAGLFLAIVKPFLYDCSVNPFCVVVFNVNVFCIVSFSDVESEEASCSWEFCVLC